MNLQELDREYIAGTYARFPVTLVSGKGSIVKDDTGKEYIDFGCGIAVTAFGIADDEWVSAVTSQLNVLQHTSNLYYTSPCVEVAKRLCERTGMKKVFFGNSGAEANECAIKIARKYQSDLGHPEKHVILTMENSFHGRTLTTLAATGQEHYHELFQPLTPGFSHIRRNDIDHAKQLFSKGDVAGVLVECVQGEGGVITMDPAFLKGLSELCRENDALLMVDEVQTGNGRTGTLYAWQQFGFVPDLFTTAKGLGGGLPIGACVIGQKAENVLKAGDHGSTFGGNPVVCAGAVSILDRLTEDFLASVREKGEFLRSAFTGAQGIEDVSGMGLMIGLKTVRNAGDIVKECRENGLLLLTAKDRVRLLPALNIPMDLLSRAAEIILEACKN